MYETVKAEPGQKVIDKNNLQVTSAFKELLKMLIVELTGEVSVIRSGAQFPPAGKFLYKKSVWNMECFWNWQKFKVIVIFFDLIYYELCGFTSLSTAVLC